MKSKIISEAKEKTYAVIFQKDDEVISLLTQFAKENKLSAARFTAIGAFSSVTIAFFDWEKKDYCNIEVNEQVEVLSLIGDIALDKGNPKIHAHVVLGKSDGSTCGGHLMKALVRPTLEVIITESPVHLKRKFNPETGLALIELSG